MPGKSTDPVTVTHELAAGVTPEELQGVMDGLFENLAAKGGRLEQAWAWQQAQDDGTSLLTVSDGPDPLA
jgi:hypothetical protein